MSTAIKCLVVDDTPENLVALEAVLRRDALDIVTARSGRDALELLLAHDFALAILDVQMPEMDGFELAELMRGAERTKHVPIIFVTAGTHDPQRVFKGYETGAVDFLFKPIDSHVLRGKAEVFFELYRHRQELSHALRLNEMFVGTLGHDLRNPLNTILTGIQLLERQVSDDKHQRTLQRMASAGQRMTDMIEQLLDLTRARLAGGLGFVRARRRVDIGNLVQRTVEELRGGHPERQIAVDVAGDCVTTGDADRLLQMFSNLVGNALHHSRPESAAQVVVQASDPEIAVRISNEGVIRPDVLPAIFDPFVRRQTARSQSHGLGLGLFIAQQIAVAHNGGITVESTDAAGTTFTVRIPRRAVGARYAAPGDNPRTVLLVDDDENIRESLRDAFEDEGYAVVTAANGREALDVLTRESARPDAVVLDLVLPVMDGGQLYQAMQANAALAAIPVVVSTSNPARAPHGLVVVPKPLKLDKLLDTVARLWEEEPVR